MKNGFGGHFRYEVKGREDRCNGGRGDGYNGYEWVSASLVIWIVKGDEGNGLDRCGSKDMNNMGECRQGISGLDDGV